jgi:hypothetical protein
MDPTAILTGLGIGAGLYLLHGGKKASTEHCYELKHEHYRRCMDIPATDRAQRDACFEQADNALAACLGQFSGYGAGEFYKAAEDQITTATTEAQAAAEAAAKAAAGQETAKFWTTAAWVGLGGVALYAVLKR